jgi:hypothetical protein
MFGHEFRVFLEPVETNYSFTAIVGVDFFCIFDAMQTQVSVCVSYGEYFFHHKLFANKNSNQTPIHIQFKYVLLPSGLQAIDAMEMLCCGLGTLHTFCHDKRNKCTSPLKYPIATRSILGFHSISFTSKFRCFSSICLKKHELSTIFVASDVNKTLTPFFLSCSSNFKINSNF